MRCFALILTSVLVACAGSTRLPIAKKDGGGTLPDGLTFRNDTSWWVGDGPPPDGQANVDAKGITPDKSITPPDKGVPADKGVPCPGGCDDGNACTTDSCQNNKCVHVNKVCNDNDACTSDACVKGSCVYTPLSCDDGDPCTADSCQSGKCSHKPAGQLVYRYFRAATGAHAFGTSATPPSGFVTEFTAFRTLPSAGAGRALVYQQVRAANGDHMLTTSASEGVACCGYANSGNIGYGLTSAKGTSIPVYRLYHASSALHLSSTSKSEGTQVGYQLEFTAFHACP